MGTGVRAEMIRDGSWNVGWEQRWELGCGRDAGAGDAPVPFALPLPSPVAVSHWRVPNTARVPSPKSLRGSPALFSGTEGFPVVSAPGT